MRRHALTVKGRKTIMKCVDCKRPAVLDIFGWCGDCFARWMRRYESGRV
jgi:hypothetical protein